MYSKIRFFYETNCIYISEYTGNKADIDQKLKSITLIAKKNNPIYDITGVLFYQNGKFVHILEGDEESLNLLLKKIEADTRHRNIEYLVKEEIHNMLLKTGIWTHSILQIKRL